MALLSSIGGFRYRNADYVIGAFSGSAAPNFVAKNFITEFDVILSWQSPAPTLRCYNAAVFRDEEHSMDYYFGPTEEAYKLGAYSNQWADFGSAVSDRAVHDELSDNDVYFARDWIVVSWDFPYFTWGLDYRISGYTCVLPTFTNLQDFINYVSTPIITYQWSSVPTISGKNGILSLTQILNINDGEAVDDVAASGNVDFSRKTKVNNLVKDVMDIDDDPKKATVKYSIPKSNYEYTKLVYKKKKIPKSISDGTAINISQDDNSVAVNDLDESSTYYFMVFTNKTRSDGYKYRTGSVPPLEGAFKERISSTKAIDDSFTMTFTETVSVTQV